MHKALKHKMKRGKLAINEAKIELYKVCIITMDTIKVLG